jgi:hypothetical protein
MWCCRFSRSGILTILKEKIIDRFLNEFDGSLSQAFPKNRQYEGGGDKSLAF